MVTSASLRVFFLCLALLTALSARAETTRHGRAFDAVESDVTRFLKHSGRPELPLLNQTLCLVVVAGVRYDVVLVGPSDRSARELAETLDAWQVKNGLGGLVRYERESDASVAVFTRNLRWLGRTSISTPVPIDSIQELAEGLEGDVVMAMIADDHAPLQTSNPPSRTREGGIRHWEFTQEGSRPAPARLELSAPMWAAVLVVGWVVMTALVPYLGLFSAYRRANAEADQATRWAAYRKTFGWFTAVGGAPSILSGALLFTSTPIDHLSVLWTNMGIWPAWVALAGIPACASMPAVTWGYTELGARFPNPSKPLNRAQNSAPTADPQRLREFAILIPIWGVGLSLVPIACLLWPDPGSPGPILSFLFTWLGTLGPIWLLNRRHKQAQMAERFPVAARNLSESARRVGDRLGQTLLPELAAPHSVNGFLTGVRGGRIVRVSTLVSEAFSPSELDFVVASEAARLFLGHRRRHVRGLGALASGFVIMTISLAFHAWSDALFWMSVGSALVMIVASALIVFGENRRTYARDDFAVRVTGDGASAVSAIKKLTLATTSPPNGIDPRAHPQLSKRVERIRAQSAADVS